MWTGVDHTGVVIMGFSLIFSFPFLFFISSLPLSFPPSFYSTSLPSFFPFFCSYLGDRVSCSVGWPWILYVPKDNPDSKDNSQGSSCLHLPGAAGISRVHHHIRASEPPQRVQAVGSDG